MDYKKIIIESYINGYERGHHDTVESVYGNYDEKADEFYEEIESAMCEASAERISSVVRCCPNTDDILKETVENALYSTGRFTTDQCTDLAEGIIIYIKDSGLKISRQ